MKPSPFFEFDWQTPIAIPQNLHQIPFAHINMSVRLENVLAQMKYKLLGDLHGKTYTEVYFTKNCGQKTVKELKLLVKQLATGNFIIPAVPPDDVNHLARESLQKSIIIPQNARGWAIDRLPMSVRLANVLRNLNIHLLGDLHGMLFVELLSTKSCGRKSLIELRDLINAVQRGKFERANIGSVKGTVSPAMQSVDGAAIYATQCVDDALETLDARTKNILLLRFGGLGSQPFTLDEIGQRYEVTRERVRQIIEKLTKRLLRHNGPAMTDALTFIAQWCFDSVCPLTPDTENFGRTATRESRSIE